MDQREYVILSSILRARLSRESEVKLLVVARDAMIPYFVMPEKMRERARSAIADRFDDFSHTAFDAFLDANENGNDLGDDFDAELPITILSRPEIDGFFAHQNPRKAPGWPAFYDRFPKSGGLVSLSRVGFDDSGIRAFCYSACQSGPTMGAGYYHQFRANGTSWTQTGKSMAYIS